MPSDAASALSRPLSGRTHSPPAARRDGQSPQSTVIDKSVLAFPEPRRIRDRDHVRYVAKQPCLVCGRQPADAHHLRFAQNPALGRKVSDEFTVPLCRGHHREVHRCGDEAVWWLRYESIRWLLLARYGLRHIRKPASFSTAHQITKRLAPAASTVFKIWAMLPQDRPSSYPRYPAAKLPVT